MELTTKQKAAFGIGAVGKDMVCLLYTSVHHRSSLLHRKAQPVPAEQLHSDCAQSCALLVVFVHRLPPAET